MTPLEELKAKNRSDLEEVAKDGPTGRAAFARLCLINDPHGIANWIDGEIAIKTEGRDLSAAFASYQSAQILNFIMTFEDPIAMLNMTLNNLLTVVRATMSGELPVSGVEIGVEDRKQREVTITGTLRERAEAAKGARR